MDFDSMLHSPISTGDPRKCCIHILGRNTCLLWRTRVHRVQYVHRHALFRRSDPVFQALDTGLDVDRGTTAVVGNKTHKLSELFRRDSIAMA